MFSGKDSMTVLRELARIASVIIDGDEASRMITADAMYHLANENEAYRFLALDHYSVDHGAFERMKKLLLRFERLSEVDFNTTVWVPVIGVDNRVTVALQNGSINRFYEFGQKAITIPAPMKRCFSENVVVDILPDDAARVVTVLAPILNSLEEVSAVLELSADAGGGGNEYA
jgi:hypothetical protein